MLFHLERPFGQDIDINSILDSVESIGVNSFYGCNAITSLKFPSSLKEIKDYAFEKCKNLAIISANSNNQIALGKNPFEGCMPNIIVNTDSQKYLNPNKLYQFPNINVINITNGVFYIYYTFTQCKNITKVNIPHSVTYIYQHSFKDCAKLIEVTIPNSVQTIQKEAFINCYSLQKMEIPNSVNSISEGCFMNCTGLLEVIIQFGSKKINIEKYAFKNCTSLKKIEIPNSVKAIYESAYEGCINVTTLIYNPYNIKTVRGWISGCSKLNNLGFNEFVDSIKNFDFDLPNQITNINIHSNINSIDRHAFDIFTNLKTVTPPESFPQLLNEFKSNYLHFV